MHKVFRVKKSVLEDGTIRQTMTLECPVFPTSTNLSTMSTKASRDIPVLAILHVTLVLDNIGHIGDQIHHPRDAEEVTVWKKKKEDNIRDVERTKDHIADTMNVRARASADQRMARSDRGGDGVGGVITLSSDSAEYKVAMELEMWRASEEKAYLVCMYCTNKTVDYCRVGIESCQR